MIEKLWLHLRLWELGAGSLCGLGTITSTGLLGAGGQCCPSKTDTSTVASDGVPRLQYFAVDPVSLKIEAEFVFSRVVHSACV